MPVHKRLLILAVVAILALFRSQHTYVGAQSGVELENAEALVDFGEQIIFIATVKSSILIQTASITITDESQGVTYVEPVNVQADGRTELRFDTRQNPLRPFTQIKWNYQFMFPDGSTTQSESFFTRYADDRFAWQTVEAGALNVSWYQGDVRFASAALDSAQAGLKSISGLVPLDLTQPVEIFVYANADDLRGTLVLGGEDWIAGHADPALGIVMVVVEPGAEQGILMEQRIPHELMHVLLYRRAGAGYDVIPTWLREGMATLAEIYPNPDYERVLADAVANNRLIPLGELCGSFPASGGQAFLAYAESRSFTQYLHDTYGSTGLLDLALTYADGVDCEHGPERAFGVPLSSLEADWRSSALGQEPFLPLLQNLAPYLVLLCLVLIIPLIGIASALRRRGNPNEPETYVRR